MIARRICFFPLLWGVFCLPAFSQNYLQREVVYHGASDTGIQEVLDKIAIDNGFYFSYESALVPVSEAVDIDYYQGNLAGFLDRLFGDQYAFKEIDGYVIIRHASGKFDLDVEMEEGNKRLLLRGYVKNESSGASVPYASVYEKNSLVASLSDAQGYFELKINSRKASSVWLTLSKAEYRDTTFVLLPAVEVGPKNTMGRFRFLPGEGSSNAVENSFAGRLFIGFKQRFQRLNLGGFFAENPVQMSFTPGLSSQGMFSSQMINHFSLNVLGGYTAGVEGFEAAGLFNINQRDVRGFQAAGIFNLAGGEMTGFQAAGILNTVYKSMDGSQVAGLVNRVHGMSKGLQIAGLFNLTDSIALYQLAGLYNRAGKIRDVQISGLVNTAQAEAGSLQVAGLYNHAPLAVKHQVSGLVNKAGNVEGIQFAGLLNIAESSDYPIGLVNLVRNGQKSFTLGTDESGYAHGSFRSGGRKLYGLIGLAYSLNSSIAPYALELGFGLHTLKKQRYFMDTELVNRIASDFDGVSNIITSVKFIQGYILRKQLSLITGPTINFSVLDNGADSVPGLVLFENTKAQGTYGMHLGLLAGLQYRF